MTCIHEQHILLCARASTVSLLCDAQRQLWHQGWYVSLSVRVYVVDGITTPCLTKKCTARSLDSGLTQTSRIRINAQRRKTCLCGRARSLFWSVCTHCSRLPTVVASERLASVWATVRNSRLFVCRQYPVMSAKRMRHAQPLLPHWVFPKHQSKIKYGKSKIPNTCAWQSGPKSLPFSYSLSLTHTHTLSHSLSWWWWLLLLL